VSRVNRSSLTTSAVCISLSFLIAAVLLLAGCGGGSSQALNPVPAPGAGSSGDSAGAGGSSGSGGANSSAPVQEFVYASTTVDPTSVSIPSKVFGFRLNRTSATLEPVPGSPFQAEARVVQMHAAMSGTQLLVSTGYFANHPNDSTLSVRPILDLGGLGQATSTARTKVMLPQGPAVYADGRFIYLLDATNKYAPVIRVFALTATGTLQEQPTLVFTLPALPAGTDDPYSTIAGIPEAVRIVSGLQLLSSAAIPQPLFSKASRLKSTVDCRRRYSRTCPAIAHWNPSRCPQSSSPALRRNSGISSVQTASPFSAMIWERLIMPRHVGWEFALMPVAHHRDPQWSMTIRDNICWLLISMTTYGSLLRILVVCSPAWDLGCRYRRDHVLSGWLSLLTTGSLLWAILETTA
jgi:hypothetical protein